MTSSLPPEDSSVPTGDSVFADSTGKDKAGPAGKKPASTAKKKGAPLPAAKSPPELGDPYVRKVGGPRDAKMKSKEAPPAPAPAPKPVDPNAKYAGPQDAKMKRKAGQDKRTGTGDAKGRRKG